MAGYKPASINLQIADVRQALFDAVKSDCGADSALRYEVGRAVGLIGKAMDAIAEMEREKAALLEAISAVLLWRVGDLPDKGYIKDVGPSRAAIGRLAGLHAEASATGAAS